MQPRTWGIPLVILALAGGVAIGMHQAGAGWLWQRSGDRISRRADLGAEARLGSPVSSGAITGPDTGGAQPSGGDSGRPAPPPAEGEVMPIGDLGKAILSSKNGTLLVVSPDGKELLRQSAQGLEGWFSWPSGGSTLLWLRYYGPDKGRVNRVFRYDAGPGRFLPVTWDGQETDHHGTLTFVADGSSLVEEAPVDPHHTRTVTWRYAGAGRLQSTPGPFHLSDAAWYPAGADGLLTAFLESVAMRLPDEARRYFADPALADSYYRVLSGQVLSYGRAHVLLGDALDPRGMEFPFFLDMEALNPASQDYYLSLQGSVSLLPSDAGKKLQISDWRYSVVPEPVGRERAVALVRGLNMVRSLPGNADFRVAHGFAHWTAVFAGSGPVFEVDSRSGEVYRLTADGQKVKVSSAP